MHFMKKIITFFLILFLFSCKQQGNTKKKAVPKKWEAPIIKDTLPLSDKGVTSAKMLTPINNMLYNGVFKDTIAVSQNAKLFNGLFIDFFSASDSICNKSDLKIIVDTTQNVTIDLENYSYPPAPILLENEEYKINESEYSIRFDKWKKRSRDFRQARAVFIVNTSNDTLYIDNQDGALFMLQEAIDEDGKWKPIEYWEYSTCGNSYGGIGIVPSGIALVKVAKYSGEFKTEMRIKLKTSKTIWYSNIFTGTINKSQFNLVKNNLEEQEYLEYIFLNK